MAKSKLPVVVATAVAVPAAAVAGVLVFKFFESNAPDPDADDLSAVSVEVPELDDEDAVVCLALTSQAPEEAAELPARSVEGGEHASEFVLAYGDPPVVATCGAEAVEVEDTAPVYMLNNVCWFTDEDGDGTEWATVDRRLPVSVTVPAEYEQPVDVLNELSHAVDEAVPAAEDAPSGCS